MKIILERFLRFKYFIFIIIIGFLSVYPLLHQGLPPTHDGEYHIIRFYEFDKVLRSGILYPRWAPDLNFGYGVPLFNYVYPLPNYLTSFVHFFGISFIDSFKLIMFFASIFGAIFFYLWTKQFYGNLGGLVSAIFYTYSPYHFLDIYIRGSVGEVLALALFPAFLWTITILLRDGNKRFIIPSGLFLSLIIFSHNILALMFLPFSVAYIILLILHPKRKIPIKDILFVLFIAFGLSSIFWLPALLEKQYVSGLELFNIKENFPEIYQLIFPSWGSGFSGGSSGDQMSFQIGIANLLAALFGVIGFFIKKKIKYFTAFFLFCFIITFFLMLRASFPIWDKIPLMNYFQFPWRLLSLEILFCSFLAGGIIRIWNSKILAAFLIIFVILLSISYTKPAFYHQRNDNYYLTRSNFIDGTNSPGNLFNTIWTAKPTQKINERLSLKSGVALIKPVSNSLTDYKFNLEIKKDSLLIANISYFPGWTVFLNGKKVNTIIKDGLFSFAVPKGNHSLEIKFADTSIREIAMLIFYTTVIGLLLLFKNIYCVKIKK